MTKSTINSQRGSLYKRRVTQGTIYAVPSRFPAISYEQRATTSSSRPFFSTPPPHPTVDKRPTSHFSYHETNSSHSTTCHSRCVITTSIRRPSYFFSQLNASYRPQASRSSGVLITAGGLLELRAKYSELSFEKIRYSTLWRIRITNQEVTTPAASYRRGSRTGSCRLQT